MLKFPKKYSVYESIIYRRSGIMRALSKDLWKYMYKTIVFLVSVHLGMTYNVWFLGLLILILFD